ncbi:hypothetical protein GGX14DRAFT_347886 [Mycena pura]|uniref:Telomerase reverse transcriptase n=1 Tax=Mycena pura TaxID=153505 RepID=A0AAD6YRX2_9AGAR|nr:hypothetical protein GGX14DRAFT_347886 [Mycena pura]
MYQNCLLSALKMDCYIRDWGLDTKKHAPFLRDTVQQMISYASTSIRNRARTQFARSHGGRSDTQRGAVTWLGMHAFHAALSRKAARYSLLLKWLQSVLKQPLNRRYARRFKSVTAEGLATIAPIYTRL